MPRYAAALFAVLWVSLGCATHSSYSPSEEGRIMPHTAAVQRAVQSPCARVPPPLVSRLWIPTDDIIAALERRLHSLRGKRVGRRSLGLRLQDPGSDRRQYVGVVIDGKKYVFVLGFQSSGEPPWWSTHLIDDCDAGQWHVLYDPETASFSGLSINLPHDS